MTLILWQAKIRTSTRRNGRTRCMSKIRRAKVKPRFLIASTLVKKNETRLHVCSRLCRVSSRSGPETSPPWFLFHWLGITQRIGQAQKAGCFVQRPGLSFGSNGFRHIANPYQAHEIGRRGRNQNKGRLLRIERAGNVLELV